MEEPFPIRDPIEGLHFTFDSDEAAFTAAVDPRPERQNAPADEQDDPLPPHQLHLGETPLTDPRALGSSALLHVLLIALGSLTVLNVSITRVPEPSPALQGELEPVDNRADKGNGGGGSPGEIGGLGSVAFVAPGRLQSPGAWS